MDIYDPRNWPCGEVLGQFATKDYGSLGALETGIGADTAAYGPFAAGSFYANASATVDSTAASLSSRDCSTGWPNFDFGTTAKYVDTALEGVYSSGTGLFAAVLFDFGPFAAAGVTPNVSATGSFGSTTEAEAWAADHSSSPYPYLSVSRAYYSHDGTTWEDCSGAFTIASITSSGSVDGIFASNSTSGVQARYYQFIYYCLSDYLFGSATDMSYAPAAIGNISLCGWQASQNSDRVLPLPTLSAPTGLSVVGTPGTTTTISWNPVAYATLYSVYLNGVLVGTTGSAFYTLANLSVGSTYTVTVVASVCSLQSPPSAPLLFTVPAPMPPPTWTGRCEGAQLSLSWTAVSAATSYTLWRDGAAVYTGTGLTFVDTGLTVGLGYTYTISASGATGLLASSVPVVYAPCDPYAPPAPSSGGTSWAGADTAPPSATWDGTGCSGTTWASSGGCGCEEMEGGS